MGNGEWGTENGEWGMGNGELGMGNDGRAVLRGGWSLRGAKRRGNLVDYQRVVRLLRFARNDIISIMQRSHSLCSVVNDYTFFIDKND